MPARVVPARPHAPLLWVLVPLMFGYGVAEALNLSLKDNLSSLGIPLNFSLLLPLIILLVVSILGGVFALRQKNFVVKWRARIYGAIAIFSLAIIYYAMREERVKVPTENVAPREATVVVEPRQAFALKPNSGKEAGIGIIREASDKKLIGEKINYSVWWDLDEPLCLGARVKMFGVLAPNVNKNGGFEEYLERMHIPWSLSRGKALSIEKPAPFYSQFVSRIHHNAIETLQLRWKKDGDTNLLPAIVIGDKADLTKEQKDAFVKSGTMHLIAVSGMNVMAVAIVLWVLVRLTVLPRVWQAGVVAALLGLYALVAGAGPSVLRAWGLVSLALLAWALKRQRNLFSIIILAATISLIVEPLSFLHAGWRMSFAVVTGVILGMNAVERSQILHRFRGVSRVVIETLIVSAIAGLCVTPMSATYWGVYQPLGFLVNAIAVALASFITILGTLSWLVAWIPGASILINEIAYFFINLIQISIERFLKMPNAYLTLPQIKETGIEVWGTIGILAVFYILARFGWRKGRKMTRKTPPHLKNEPKEIAASSAVQ